MVFVFFVVFPSVFGEEMALSGGSLALIQEDDTGGRVYSDACGYVTYISPFVEIGWFWFCL